MFNKIPVRTNKVLDHWNCLLKILLYFFTLLQTFWWQQPVSALCFGQIKIDRNKCEWKQTKSLIRANSNHPPFFHSLSLVVKRSHLNWIVGATAAVACERMNVRVCCGTTIFYHSYTKIISASFGSSTD